MKKSTIISCLFTLVIAQAFSQPLAGYKFCIDPGHGGHDPANDRRIELPYGIIYWESEGVFETALHLKKYLNDLGADVILTRTDNTDESDISLSARSTIANTFGADFFQSVHTNAFNQTSNYTLVLFKGTDASPAFPEAKIMGDMMAPAIYNVLRTTASYNRGDFSFLGYNLGVLNGAMMPSILSEGSFHDVPAEGLRLKNSEYLRNYAWAVAKTFCQYYQVNGFPVGRVGGIVKDFKTGSPLNELTVIASPGEKSYTGDNYYNGFYALDSLIPGTYTLTFTKEGYLPKSEEVVISANSFSKLDVVLQYYNNGYPNIDFTMSHNVASPGTIILLDASGCYDDGEIVSYEWDFGDGNTASGMETNHIYNISGIFTIKLTVTDDEGKSSELTKSIDIQTTIPEAPVLLYVVKNSTGGIKLKWSPVTNPVLDGYRIYITNDDDLTGFNLLYDENDINSGTTEYVVDPGTNLSGYNFKITAVNSAGESISSDTYSYVETNQPMPKDILIVDGFDRFAGSYKQANHTFTATYMQTLRDAGEVNIASCANEAVVDNLINLASYDLLVWFLGDESTANETFSSAEQPILIDFLEQGGYLFTCGSEIGWDLWSQGSSSDKTFYSNYLKAAFIDDGTSSGRSPAAGISSTIFDGVSLNFGQVYPEDYPDGIGANSGSIDIMAYASGINCGIAYKGVFGTSSHVGGVIYLGFPIETVSDKESINLFMQKLLAYFEGEATAIDELQGNIGLNVYPTVFSDIITITSDTPDYEKMHIQLTDMNGKTKMIESLIMKPDGNKTMINLDDLPTGAYILKIITPKQNKSFPVFKR